MRAHGCDSLDNRLHFFFRTGEKRGGCKSFRTKPILTLGLLIVACARDEGCLPVRGTTGPFITPFHNEMTFYRSEVAQYTPLIMNYLVPSEKNILSRCILCNCVSHKGNEWSTKVKSRARI